MKLSHTKTIFGFTQINKTKETKNKNTKSNEADNNRFIHIHDENNFLPVVVFCFDDKNGIETELYKLMAISVRKITLQKEKHIRTHTHKRQSFDEKQTVHFCLKVTKLHTTFGNYYLITRFFSFHEPNQRMKKKV